MTTHGSSASEKSDDRSTYYRSKDVKRCAWVAAVMVASTFVVASVFGLNDWTIPSIGVMLTVLVSMFRPKPVTLTSDYRASVLVLALDGSEQQRFPVSAPDPDALQQAIRTCLGDEAVPARLLLPCYDAARRQAEADGSGVFAVTIRTADAGTLITIAVAGPEARETA